MRIRNVIPPSSFAQKIAFIQALLTHAAVARSQAKSLLNVRTCSSDFFGGFLPCQAVDNWLTQRHIPAGELLNASPHLS